MRKHAGKKAAGKSLKFFALLLAVILTAGNLAYSVPASQKSQKLTIRAAAKISVGKTTTLKVKGLYGSPKYTYRSSNTDVASVTSSGKVKAKKVGRSKITVSCASTKQYAAVSASIIIKVVPEATKKLTATNLKKGIRLTWGKVAGANSYLLYRDGKRIATIGKGSTVTFLDTGAKAEKKKYVYKLVAKAWTGTSILARKVKARRKTPKTSIGKSYTSSGSSGLIASGVASGVASGSARISRTDTGGGSSGGSSSTSEGTGGGSSGGSSSTSEGTGSGSSGGTSDNSPEAAALLTVRYCFEKNKVRTTLESCKAGDLAVIDMYGISRSVISAATARGVKVYGYLNAGAIENQRNYYSKFESIRIAEYDGWEGEYWVDVTNEDWKKHLLEEAAGIKAAGASGIYLDNTDILYMIEEGFAEDRTKMMLPAPSAEDAYQALRDSVKTIRNSVGITVMPNGGDSFVKRFIKENPGVITEVNQESVLYEDNRAQSASERKYYTNYLDWCKNQGIIVRGIEYTNSEANARTCIEYYLNHGWTSLYISRHETLEGD